MTPEKKYLRFALPTLPVIIGMLALVGWTLDSDYLRQGIVSSVAMNPATAIGFILLGLEALRLHARNNNPFISRAGQLAIWLVIIASAMKLGDLVLGTTFNIDQLLFAAQLDMEFVYPNRMAPNTALCLVLLGLSALSMRSPSKLAIPAAQALTIIPALSGMLAIVGYIYGTESFYGIGSYIPMAFNTAIAFIFLTLAILFIYPAEGCMRVLTSGGAAGKIAATLLPAALIAPFMVGWITLAILDAGLVDHALDHALSVVVNAAAFFALSYFSIRTLFLSDLHRQQAEAKLHNAEECYRKVFEEANYAIAFADAETGVLLDLNQSFANMFEWERAELIGKPQKVIHPNVGEVTVSSSFERHRSGSSGSTIETQAITKNGRIIEVSIKACVIELKERKVILGSFSDFTAQKLAEQKLTELVHKLEEKEHAKTRFLAAASHDMRQPVAAAKLLVETLKLSSPPPNQHETIQRLDQSMSILSLMLDRLLDISKFDAGLVKPQLTTFDLAKVLLQLDQDFTQAARNRQLRFNLFFPMTKPLIVRTDRGLLQSVLINLVTNSLKYTERGGILISARIRFNQVLVQVWDTGIGIAEEYLPKIFDEFYQVGNPHRNRDAGLGLGLAICHRSLSVLGSAIACRSRPGRGSVFQFSLPLVDGKDRIESQKGIDQPEPADEIADRQLFNGKNVVLLEDDQLLAQSMIGWLETMGGDVKCFHSSEEALGDANIEHADYYIVDHMLAGEENGIQFLQQLGQIRRKPIKAVILTGDTSGKVAHAAKILDFPVLYKPVSTSSLADVLSKPVETRASPMRHSSPEA